MPVDKKLTIQKILRLNKQFEPHKKNPGCSGRVNSSYVTSKNKFSGNTRIHAEMVKYQPFDKI